MCAQRYGVSWNDKFCYLYRSSRSFNISPGILIFFIYQRSNLLNLHLPEPESRSKAPSQIHDQTRTQMLKAEDNSIFLIGNSNCLDSGVSVFSCPRFVWHVQFILYKVSSFVLKNLFAKLFIPSYYGLQNLFYVRPSPFFSLSVKCVSWCGVGRSDCKKNSKKKVTRSLGIGAPGTPGRR